MLKSLCVLAMIGLLGCADEPTNPPPSDNGAADVDSLPDSVPGPVCGDSVCGPTEDASGCPADCGSWCGDGSCDADESTATCLADCGSWCGDGACNGTETPANCSNDCGPVCGDGICDAGVEDCGTCLTDCPCAQDETCQKNQCVTGTTTSTIVRIDPEDPHRFVRGDESVYLVGYYPSIAAMVADQTDYENYYSNLVDRLAANRINYFRQVMTMGQPYGEAMIPYMATGPGQAAGGGLKVDLEQFNPAYFDYWRKVVQYAESKGVVVQITLFDTWHNKAPVVDADDPENPWGMDFDFYSGANNVNGVHTPDVFAWTDPSQPVFQVHKAYIQKAVDTLGDLPNIVWEICNENYYNESWELQLSDYLTEYEAQKGLAPHIVMPRDLPNHDSAGGKQNNPTQTHDEMVQRFSWDKPLIGDNDGGGDADLDERRAKAWAALTAGGTIDYFHYDMFQQAVLDGEDVANGLQHVGYTRKFLEDLSVDLRGSKPSDGLVSAGWCLARPGETYIVYLPDGGKTTVSALPGSFAATWFNPRDGTSMTAAGGPEFSAPDNQDWVLYIDGDGSDGPCVPVGECGPAPHYMLKNCVCLPSCGALKNEMGWDDAQCAPNSCPGEGGESWDCNHCCEVQ